MTYSESAMRLNNARTRTPLCRFNPLQLELLASLKLFGATHAFRTSERGPTSGRSTVTRRHRFRRWWRSDLVQGYEA